MKHRTAFWGILSAAFLALGLTLGLLAREQAELAAATSKPPAAAELAAGIELRSVAGEPATLPFGERAFVANFWGVWCPPCRHELPLLDQAHAQGPLPVYAVAVDETQRVADFLEELPLGLEIVVAGLENGFLLSERLGNDAQVMPYTVVFDASGALAGKKSGPFATVEEIVDFMKLALAGS